MKKTEPLVLFDVGAVLLELKYREFYEKGAEISGKTPEEFRREYIESHLELRALKGELTKEEARAILIKMLGKPDISKEELETLILKNWGGEITSVVDLKEKIYFDGCVDVGIFSNTDLSAVERLLRRFPRMLQTFNPQAPFICSYMVGDVKPNPPMYEAVQRFGFKTVTLIDDKYSYLRAGIENFGWNGILFTPYQDSAEAIRHEKGHNELMDLSRKNLKVANSVSELEQALRDFGIKL